MHVQRLSTDTRPGAARGRLPDALRLLAYLLRNGGRIDDETARRRLRIKKLEDRVRELEDEGVSLLRIPFVTVTRHGRHVRETTYHLGTVPARLIDELEAVLGHRV